MGEKVIDYALGEENGVIQIHLEGFQYYFPLFPQKDYIVLKNQETGMTFYCHQSPHGLTINGKLIALSSRRPSRGSSDSDLADDLTTPMPGKIIKLYVKNGDQVEKGAKLFSMEAMKMEHTITAPFHGEIKNVFFGEGQQVEAGVHVVELEEKS